MNNIIVTRTISKQLELSTLKESLNETLDNNVLAISRQDNIVQFILSQAIDELALDSIVDNYDIEQHKFMYNDKFDINLEDDFTLWYKFHLRSTADIDTWGDKQNIKWYNDNELCIEEFPLYTRTKLGTGLLSELELKRDLTLRYYRRNGRYVDVSLPTKYYNEVERKHADTKSRTNIIENTRQKTGEYIYVKNIQAGTPQNIETELGAALMLLESLQAQISVYRLDREHMPLVTSLQTTAPTVDVPQDVLDFIIHKVNIDYYA